MYNRTIDLLVSVLASSDFYLKYLYNRQGNIQN